MEKRYVSITVTRFEEAPTLNTGVLYWIDLHGQEHTRFLSYGAGMILLRKLERAMGKVAQLDCNRFSNTICYKTLRGYV